jgi:hypothetical protein
MPKKEKSTRRTGRPSVLTPELQIRVCQFVAGGAPVHRACAAAGVSWGTAQEWFTPGYRDREPYKGFVEAIEQAKGAHVVGCTMRITQAARRGAWQADLAILDRRYPEDYRPGGAGRRVSVEFEGDAPSTPREEGAHITDAELEVIIRRGQARA